MTAEQLVRLGDELGLATQRHDVSGIEESHQLPVAKQRQRLQKPAHAVRHRKALRGFQLPEAIGSLASSMVVKTSRLAAPCSSVSRSRTPCSRVSRALA